ncbi:S1 RNA-binding domain-containing protein 1-like [Penaeus indicus]|uniref:S1 RNA-binding domain-containing protein 1-like n=1 Tax=Penaeus indicus TaxID=29960 RepID=UPI00300CF956
MSTNNALEDSIVILEEVEGTRPLAGGTGIELEVLYDGQGEEVQHVQPQPQPPQQQSKAQPSRPPLRQQPQRQRRPVQQYQQQQQEQQQQAAQQRLQRQQQRQQQQRQQQQQRAQQRQAQQQQQKQQQQQQQAQQRGVKRKDSEVQVVGQTKAQKTGRGEVGGAGTLKYRKRIPDNDIEIVFEWDPAKVIAERQSVDEWVARNVISMFDQENTLPFIARYRKERTGNMEVEKLREIQNAYSQLKHVQERVLKILKGDRKRLPEDRKASLLRATTMHEVEHLTAAYKGSGKRTYAERARELGLEPAALEVMQGTHNKFSNRQELYSLMDLNKEGLRTIEEVEQGLQHIIADVISKDPQVLDCVRQLMKLCKPVLECSKARKQMKRDQGKMVSRGPGPSNDLCAKYENYFEYKNLAWNTKPHSMLAMNRGEHQGVLSVKVAIPDNTYIHFFNYCQQKWLGMAPPHYYRTQLVMMSIEDSWERLVKPFMQRQIRSELTEMAEIASVEVFAANLRKLLLTPPVRGKTVLAIDPGYANGCKIGVTSPTGEKLLTTTIYPFRGNQHLQVEDWCKDHNARTLREIVHKYRCELFAIGNGTGCRETETYLTRLIAQKCFDPYNVQYTIINETGASQYSVSPEARTEFPGLDPNHISALSLARRLQDPLLEYIKVHPMHMGVGMYQHDIPERILHASLDSVMTECVSFVGVDINSASEFVLRKLSGLNKPRAANIVEYRKTKGPFINREQLKSVKGIGPRTFEQCAGFIRIMPETLEMEINKTPQGKKRAEKEAVSPLDRTMIHPESYGAAMKLLNIVGVRAQDIGADHLIRTVRHFMPTTTLDALSEQCETTLPTMQLIVEGLTQPLDYDIRAQFEKPLFRKGITSIDDVALGTKLTGTVRNVTHFGAFVDVGLGNDGLVHVTKMAGVRLELGNIVEVSVISIEKERARIGLMLERLIG